MAVVYLLCGKVGCGKSTYAKKLKQQAGGVILSCDELMLSLFSEHMFDKHQEILDKSSAYLFDLALELHSAGVDAILDFGFWTKESRQYARTFFAQQCVETRLIYINIPEELRAENLNKRNEKLSAGDGMGYAIDEGMKKILDGKFEEPSSDEVDEVVSKL